MNEKETPNWVAVGEIRAGVNLLLEAMKEQGRAIVQLRTDNKQDLSELRNDLKKELHRYETRLSAVEQFQWRLAGVLGVVALVLPLALTIVGYIL